VSSILGPVQNDTIATTRHVRATLAGGPVLFGIQRNRSLLELEASMPSEIEAISPMVEQLMRLIEASRCIVGSEFAVELALHEALKNAVIHGNGMDADKLVGVRCRCERGKGVWLTVKDQGKGFDQSAVPSSLGPGGLQAAHGRGICLLKQMMDEVSFELGGTEVHMRKGPVRPATAQLLTNNTSANQNSAKR
jgi:serine/threonine-protein kinase RsbW